MKKDILDRTGYGYDPDTAAINVHRPIYQQEELNRDSLYEKPHTPFSKKIGNRIRSISALACLLRSIPVLKWLPGYRWKKHFVGDIISGLTVAVMHIPQGMAYGLLGGVPPVVGIYMAFFPVLVYFIFGTSRHVSIGTFAVVCLMTGTVVHEHSTVEILQNGTTVHSPSAPASAPQYSNIEVATSVTFTVAVIQLLMYFFRLGIVSNLLSDTLVSAFTCASAFHVVSSQLKDLFGLPVRKRRGNFSFLFTIYDALAAIPSANRYACGVSLVTLAILILNNALLKRWLAKKTRIPFPIELFAVVLGTTLSYCLSFEVAYGISNVGHISTGLPDAALPAFSLIPEILLDSFIITMVSYTITMSMAFIFAKKLMYEVDSNQELLALGLSNTVGSFFACMPVTASLSRSTIQQAVGGVTQLASVVSCAILLVILLWIGPFFETLPRCVLASIIIVALRGMLLQFRSIVKYWKLSKWDAIVWIVTFGTTLFIQISYGLAAGVAMSLLSILIQGYTPYTCLLGVVPNTDLYLDINRFKGAYEISGIKIFHYSGGLCFASKASFKELLTKKISFDPSSLLRKRNKLRDLGNASESSAADDLLIKCVILDFSALTFIDPAGVDQLRHLQMDFGKLDVGLYIAACCGPVFEVLVKCDRQEGIDSQFMVFPTVHDAVLFAQSHLLNVKYV